MVSCSSSRVSVLFQGRPPTPGHSPSPYLYNWRVRSPPTRDPTVTVVGNPGRPGLQGDEGTEGAGDEDRRGRKE